MSPSDVHLGEVEMLRRLRRHRADRAERALREAKRAQQALLAHIQRAQDALEQTRQEEARKSAQLLSQHQGQVLSLKALKSWGAKERSSLLAPNGTWASWRRYAASRVKEKVALAAPRSRSSACGR